MGFAVAASFTPGPNNIMLAAASSSHGVRPVLPMLVGIQIGFVAMLVASGFGLAGLLMQWPLVQSALRWLGIGWLLLLAWKIASAPAPGMDTAERRPVLGLVGAAFIQLVNPKAWLLCLAVATSWIARDLPLGRQVLTIGLVFTVVGVCASSLWVAIGVGAARALHTPARLRVFNVVMAVLLVASVLPLALAR